MTESKFEAMNLAQPLLRALATKGYTEPSPIQAMAIPSILAGRDMLACAQTGTGKTAAFALPILHHLHESNRHPHKREVRCLVLTPTRELAVQVCDSFQTYGGNLDMSIALVYGGVSQQPQVRALKYGLDVLVATPGRLLDLCQQGYADLSKVAFFVLDEADRMLDMGFINDIRKIAAQIPKQRQTLLFSATMAPEVAGLAANLLHNPEEIRIAPEVTTAEKITQSVLFVQRENKQQLLEDLLLRQQGVDKHALSIVFSRTKHGANRLAKQLNRAGFRADAIHGNKSQNARQRTLDQFREGKTPILVATDVAARGIDVRNISLVVNFDLPTEPDNYVHRIGRTARAGKSGRALTLCSADELPILRAIERLIKQTVTIDNDHDHHASAVESAYRNGKSQKHSGPSPRHNPRIQSHARSSHTRAAPRSNRNSRFSRFSKRPARDA